MDNRPRGSLTLRVTDRLRSAILNGEVDLGDALSEDKLATILGVSRSPVREALATLEQEGLIVVRPQRGSFVFKPTHEDTVNLCAFRAVIEAEALRLAIARKRDDTIAAMRRAAGDMRHAMETGDTLASARADTQFHAAAITNSGNPYLAAAYSLVAAKVAALRSHRSAVPSRIVANDEHLAIVALLTQGDLAAAVAALVNHIHKMAERYNLTPPEPARGTRAARAASLDHIGPLPD